MASPKRLVLFVEGEGDRGAVPILVKRLLTELGGWSDLFLDPQPFVVGNVADLTAHEGSEWVRFLGAARSRPKLGAVLLLQDGDLGRIRGEEFCAAAFGSRLAEWARTAGAGTLFSVSTVFACQEYESWMLACADRLAGLQLPDGRPGIRPGTTAPGGDLEHAPRDAKGWMDQHIEAGYKPTRDQGPFTQLLTDHLDAVRARGMRSFQRLEKALSELLNAIRTGTPIVTPETHPAPAE
jgi:hypothetical protein